MPQIYPAAQISPSGQTLVNESITGFPLIAIPARVGYALGMNTTNTPMEWQPIETAPKNVDVILTDGVNVSEGGWLSDIDAGADYEGQLGMAGWWAVAWPDEHGVKPTHWMPLPQPPKAQS